MFYKVVLQHRVHLWRQYISVLISTLGIHLEECNKDEELKKTKKTKLYLKSVSVPLVYKIHIPVKFSCKNHLLDTAGEQRAGFEC